MSRWDCEKGFGRLPRLTEEALEFFKGLMFVIAIYFISIGIYYFGYMMGVKGEEYKAVLANQKIRNCAGAFDGK